MQYVYSTVYAAAEGGGRESIYNDYRFFENRLLSKKCMKFSILARFGDLCCFFQIVRNFLSQMVAAFGRLGPIVKLATFGDFPDLFWRLAAPNTWQPWSFSAEVLRYATYSPDLVLSDDHFFRSMNNALQFVPQQIGITVAFRLFYKVTGYKKVRNRFVQS